MKRNTLPVAYCEKNGRVVLTEPYEPSNRITCTPYGEMSDGTMVWEDGNGKQYIRNRFCGKFYFVEL